MGKSRKNHGSPAGLILAVVGISLVVALWQWIVLGIILWMLCRVLWKIHLRKDTGTSPMTTRLRLPQPEPVRTATVPRRAADSAAKPRPVPARGLPAPDYLPRWTTSRRFYADREHHDWQKQFDSMV